VKPYTNIRALWRPLAGLLLANIGPACEAGTVPADAWTLSLRADHHVDAVPLGALGDDEATRRALSPRPGRNVAYVDDEARVGRRVGPWHWSLLARSQATLVSSEDALDLVRGLERDAVPASDRTWHTHVRYQAFQGAGVEVAQVLSPHPGWHASWSLQLLRLSHWRERDIDGPVHFDAASATYAFDLRSTELSDRLDFPFRTGYASAGTGALAGGELGYRGEAVSLSVAVRDVGQLRWRDLPQQRATLSTETGSYDADGFLVYQPLVQGRNSQTGYRQWLPGRWSMRAAWRHDALGELEASSAWIDGFGALPALAWYTPVQDGRLGLHWRVHERRAGVSFEWAGWQLKLGADRLGGGAHTREVSIVGGLAY
jgi:hypothetical protein